MTKDSIKDLVDSFNSGPRLDDHKIEVVLTPRSVYLEWTCSLLRLDSAISAQTCWIKSGGAFTVELDVKMTADVQAGWCILGHTERRNFPQLKETEPDIATKVIYATTQAGLHVMFYICELLDEREPG